MTDKMTWEFRVDYLRSAARAEQAQADEHIAKANWFNTLADSLMLALKEGKFDD